MAGTLIFLACIGASCLGGDGSNRETAGGRGVVQAISRQFWRATQPVRPGLPMGRQPFFAQSWPATFEVDGSGALGSQAADESAPKLDGLILPPPPRLGRLAIRLAASALGELRVEVQGAPGIWIEERLDGAARASRAKVVDGRVVYPAAKAGIDRIYEVSARRVEEYLRIADARALENLSYHIETGQGIAELVADGSGHGLLAVDAAGNPVLKAPQPVGVDARGDRVQGTLLASRIEGRRFNARVGLLGDPDRVHFPVLLDPSWVSTKAMAVARQGHTATPLPNGAVLLAGGFAGGLLGSTEVYDPATGTWLPSGSMMIARMGHTATLLPNGKVLVAGGTGSDLLADAELYDPAKGTWSPTASMADARGQHTATLLPGGKVLVAGGCGGAGSKVRSTAELYDPTSATWSKTGSLAGARCYHTATLLADGKVLVAGGAVFQDEWLDPLSSAEVYDPAAGTWSAAASLAGARAFHVATRTPDGKVLVAGGLGDSYSLSSAEVYDPAAGTWSSAAPMSCARQRPTATLLPSGRVLVATGGPGADSDRSADLYDPADGTWTPTCALMAAYALSTATLMPDGNVLIAGVTSSDHGASAEVYEAAEGSWTATGALTAARSDHTATLLPEGKVLVAGGRNTSDVVDAVEAYDPATGTWSKANSLLAKRESHTATLLANGKALVVGGRDRGAALASAEVFDAATATWTTTGALSVARYQHTATLLPSGNVLVAGGHDDTASSSGMGTSLGSAEVYDSQAGKWSATGALMAARYQHTATLLSSGKVLVVGGWGAGIVPTAELFEPATGTWTTTGSPKVARYQHTATLLPSGAVLVVGGADSSGDATGSVELYDPAEGTWTTTGSLGIARREHTATLLPSGKVLVAGGLSTSGPFVSAEVYDPTSGTWTAAGSLPASVGYHTATLLSSGKVLVVGGGNHFDFVSSGAEVYDEGRGASASWTPTLSGPLVPVSASASMSLTGTLFTRVSEGSSGNAQSSPANNPLLLLRRLDNEAAAFATATAWTATTATFTLPAWLHKGEYLAWVVVGAVLSNGQVFHVDLCNTPDRCGSDCLACSGTNSSVSVCSGPAEPAASACTITCLPGFANLDGDKSNGCEAISTALDAAVAAPDAAVAPPDVAMPSDVAPAGTDAESSKPRLARRSGCSCSAWPGRFEPVSVLVLVTLLGLLGRRFSIRGEESSAVTSCWRHRPVRRPRPGDLASASTRPHSRPWIWPVRNRRR